MKGHPFSLSPLFQPKPSWALEGEEIPRAEICWYCGRENPTRNHYNPFCGQTCETSYAVDHI